MLHRDCIGIILPYSLQAPSKSPLFALKPAISTSPSADRNAWGSCLGWMPPPFGVWKLGVPFGGPHNKKERFWTPLFVERPSSSEVYDYIYKMEIVVSGQYPMRLPKSMSDEPFASLLRLELTKGLQDCPLRHTPSGRAASGRCCAIHPNRGKGM